MMTQFPSVYHDKYNSTIDVSGIPKESIKVTVQVQDDSIRRTLEKMIVTEKEIMKRFADRGMYAGAANCKHKVAAYERVLTLFATS